MKFISRFAVIALFLLATISAQAGTKEDLINVHGVIGDYFANASNDGGYFGYGVYAFATLKTYSGSDCGGIFSAEENFGGDVMLSIDYTNMSPVQIGKTMTGEPSIVLTGGRCGVAGSDSLNNICSNINVKAEHTAEVLPLAQAMQSLVEYCNR